MKAVLYIILLLMVVRAVGSSSTASVTKECTISTELKEGDRTRDVACLQTHLQTLGFPPGPIDKFFGSRTAQAVRDYQTNHNLVVDGAVGKQTATDMGIWASSGSGSGSGTGTQTTTPSGGTKVTTSTSVVTLTTTAISVPSEPITAVTLVPLVTVSVTTQPQG